MFPINAVVVSDPAASFAGQCHYQRDLHTKRFSLYLTSPNLFPSQAIKIPGV